MTSLDKFEEQISSTIENFLKQLDGVDINALSDAELIELQSVISDFKGDLSALKELENLSATLKDSLDAKAVNELKSEMSADKAIALQQAKEKKILRNQSNEFGKLQRD